MPSDAWDRMKAMPEPDQPTLSFEKAMEQLDAIVKELESGELPLERALELFEKGMQLSETCRKQLLEAESRVEVLLKKAGKIQAEPFENSNG